MPPRSCGWRRTGAATPSACAAAGAASWRSSSPSAGAPSPTAAARVPAPLASVPSLASEPGALRLAAAGQVEARAARAPGPAPPGASADTSGASAGVSKGSWCLAVASGAHPQHAQRKSRLRPHTLLHVQGRQQPQRRSRTSLCRVQCGLYAACPASDKRGERADLGSGPMDHVGMSY